MFPADAVRYIKLVREVCPLFPTANSLRLNLGARDRPTHVEPAAKRTRHR